MVDIHSHILWGVDDGAQDLAESLAMLQMAKAAGTTDIVATPHSDSQFEFRPEVVTERLAELANLGPKGLRIHRGCDFHMNIENIEACLTNAPKFTINGLGYLMVEFADSFISPSTEEIFRQFQTRSVTPVITHPERNPILQQSAPRLKNWVQSGCVVQVTGQSLIGRFGKAAQKSAWSLLREGLVHAIASDAHDTVDRTPRLDTAREVLTKELGAPAASSLLVENPSAVVAGQPIPVRLPKKKRFFFG
jgi:protein-tyrosine phosphatase